MTLSVVVIIDNNITHTGELLSVDIVIWTVTLAIEQIEFFNKDQLLAWEPVDNVCKILLMLWMSVYNVMIFQPIDSIEEQHQRSIDCQDSFLNTMWYDGNGENNIPPRFSPNADET